jgi:hypothetical protein
MYCDPDFKTKRALKAAIAAGETVRVVSPGPFPAPTDGSTDVEGPHGVHTWYAVVDVADGVVTRVR